MISENLLSLANLHSDPESHIKQSGKMILSHIEEGTAATYRGLIIMPGIKPKESSFFPDSMAGEQVIKLFDNLLKNEDIRILECIGGKVKVKASTNLGFDVIFRVNRATGEVQSAYPWCAKWKKSLMRLIFEKGKP